MEDEITYPPSHPLSRFKNVLWSLEFLTAVKNSEKELNLLTWKDLVILFGNKAKGSVDYKPFEVLLQLANDVVLAEISELPLGKLDKQLVQFTILILQVAFLLCQRRLRIRMWLPSIYKPHQSIE